MDRRRPLAILGDRKIASDRHIKVVQKEKHGIPDT
jgi:hypothetical protein